MTHDPVSDPAVELRGMETDTISTLPLDGAIEALLFIVDRPLPLVTIAAAVHRPLDFVQQSLERLAAKHAGGEQPSVSGIELRHVGGGWRLFAKEEFDPVIADFVESDSPTKLSQAALETLAVIAYKQPITRGQIASIRAVNVDSVVRTLLSHGLIEEDHADAETGAMYFVTSDYFLNAMGIDSLDDLPPISPLLPDADEGFTDVL